MSLSNNFEAKIIDRDTTKKELKKIKLLNNLNLTTSYNIAADSLNMAPIRMSSGLSLLKDKMSINFGATFDPYTLNSQNQRIGMYHIANGGGLARLTSANVNMNYSINNNTFKRNGNKKEEKKKIPKSHQVVAVMMIYLDGQPISTTSKIIKVKATKNPLPNIHPIKPKFLGTLSLLIP